jgi:hypothetical protein
MYYVLWKQIGCLICVIFFAKLDLGTGGFRVAPPKFVHFLSIFTGFFTPGFCRWFSNSG